MDTCIVLRTALVKDGRMAVQAGAGIVYDSDPASEQQECVNKAKALFRAAEDGRVGNARAGPNGSGEVDASPGGAPSHQLRRHRRQRAAPRVA